MYCISHDVNTFISNQKGRNLTKNGHIHKKLMFSSQTHPQSGPPHKQDDESVFSR